MSLAWVTVVLLVLLAPGLSFWWGFFSTSRFSRDVASDSILLQIAGVVMPSFLIHGLLIFALPRVQHWRGVNLLNVLAVLQLEGAKEVPLWVLADSATNSMGWILVYVLASFLGGWLSGFAAGHLVRFRPFRSLVRRDSIYQTYLERGYFTHAHVLTHIQQGDLILMYSGFLREFLLTKDGRIGHLVLSWPTRFYMKLKKWGPVTDDYSKRQEIGGARSRGASADDNTLLIEGEDIANVYFEKIGWRASPGRFQPNPSRFTVILGRLRDLVARVRRPRQPATTTSTSN